MEMKISLSGLISKVFIIVAASIAFGLFMYYDEIEQNKNAKELTLEKYTADYESYRKSLQTEQTSMPIAILVSLVMGSVFFGFYELLALLIKTIIEAMGKLFNQSEETRDFLAQ